MNKEIGRPKGGRGEMIDGKEFGEYTVYKKEDGNCYFCSRPATNNVRIPSYWEFRSGKRTDDMRTYRVCATCIPRVENWKGFKHEELVQMIAALEERGAKQGRPNFLERSKYPLVRLTDVVQLIRIKDLKGNTYRFEAEVSDDWTVTLIIDVSEPTAKG